MYVSMSTWALAGQTSVALLNSSQLQTIVSSGGQTTLGLPIEKVNLQVFTDFIAARAAMQAIRQSVEGYLGQEYFVRNGNQQIFLTAWDSEAAYLVYRAEANAQGAQSAFTVAQLAICSLFGLNRTSTVFTSSLTSPTGLTQAYLEASHPEVFNS